jgi:hypothetical protein
MNDLKDRIDALCSKAIAAPDGSEELKSAIDELRSALADYVARHLRRQAAELRQKDVPLFDDEGEG